MTPIEEQIKLLQALLEGKTLQVANKSDPTNWKDASPDWHEMIKRGSHFIDMGTYNWRIKPEPDVKWLNLYSDGSAIAYANEQDAKTLGRKGYHARVAVKYQEVL